MWALGTFWLIYVTPVVVLLGRHALKRRGFHPARALAQLRTQAYDAFCAGASLAPVRAELALTLERIPAAVKSAMNQSQVRAVEAELRIIGGILALEAREPDEAREVLDATVMHELHEVGFARWLVSTGRTEGHVQLETKDPFWLAMVRDTNAQHDLLRDVPVIETDVFPTTRARMLARDGEEDDAFERLCKLAPDRLDAFLHTFPDDPATHLWHRRSSGPYR